MQLGWLSNNQNILQLCHVKAKPYNTIVQHLLCVAVPASSTISHVVDTGVNEIRISNAYSL